MRPLAFPLRPVSLCFALATILSSHAQVFLFGDPQLTGGVSIGSAGTYGASFTVGSQPISVNALGVWDPGQDGLSVSHDVGIWNANGDLLASGTVPSGTSAPLQGQYRYLSLTQPITLSANTDYTVGAFLDGGNDSIVPGASPGAIDSAISSASSVFSSGGSLTMPVNSDPQMEPWANMELTPVPEPAAYGAATGLALLGFAIWRSRRIHKRKEGPSVVSLTQ
jgi:Domain of unknown function (DUF4082)